MNGVKFMNFSEFNKNFPTQLSCIENFIKLRYNNEIKCHHYQSQKFSHRKDFPKMFQCIDCGNSFSIFKGTIFEKLDTDLRKWMYAIHLFLNGKKGISGYQLQREIGVTYKTAWRTKINPSALKSFLDTTNKRNIKVKSDNLLQ